MLAVVVVNWNSGGQLRACLASIRRFSSGQVASVVVVDNNSTDDSLCELDCGSIPVVLIRNPKNVGFAAACNQGAGQTESPYILFLNPDTVLYEHSLAVPLAFMEDARNAHVGICGIQLQDEAGGVARTCARFPRPGMFFWKALGMGGLPGLSHTMREWDHLAGREVDQLMGAFFMVRRTLFDQLGGFDQRFFVYFEEVDFSLRARQAGWRSYYLAAAHAFHAGGGTSRQVRAKRLFYSLRSRILYGFKHFSGLGAWGLLLTTLGIEPVSRTVLALGRGSLGELRNTWEGYGLLLRDMPAILRTALGARR